MPDVMTQQEINDELDAMAPDLDALKGDIRNQMERYRAIGQGEFFLDNILDAVDIER